jgi:hypothetical protein
MRNRDYSDARGLTASTTTARPTPRWRTVAVSFTPFCWGLRWEPLPKGWDGERITRNVLCFEVVSEFGDPTPHAGGTDA